MEAVDKIPETYYPPPSQRTERLKALIAYDKKYAESRPPVQGKAIDYIYMPPGGFMRGMVIKKEQVIRILSFQGNQACDVIIWDAHNMDNKQNCGWTMSLNRKWTHWRPGDVFFSNMLDKLATITEDTTDGTHDIHAHFCHERANYIRYGIPGTPNCRDNLVSAMAEYNFTANDIDSCNCIALFANMPYNADGSKSMGPSPNKPGDYVDIMAEMDIVVAISNCPGLRSPTSSGPTAMMAVIFQPDEKYMAKVATLPKPALLRAHDLYPDCE